METYKFYGNYCCNMEPVDDQGTYSIRCGTHNECLIQLPNDIKSFGKEMRRIVVRKKVSLELPEGSVIFVPNVAVVKTD